MLKYSRTSVLSSTVLERRAALEGSVALGTKAVTDVKARRTIQACFIIMVFVVAVCFVLSLDDNREQIVILSRQLPLFFAIQFQLASID